jgi:transposase
VFDPVLPEPLDARSCQLQISAEAIVILARTTAPTAACPACGQASARVHSRYTRTLTDLPWHGRPVRLVLEVRKFFCDACGCRRRIFAERVPNVTTPHARQTARLAQALSGIAFACGGEGGARLTRRLGMATSPDTLLRRIRQMPLVVHRTPRVLGVDDWALRRGQRYGTILCDLEQHRPVDLLGERSAEVLSDWLSTRPGVEVISRDRAGCYAHGATAGAPGAQQVADRWHLLHNVREALIRLLDRRQPALRATARAVASSQAPRAPPILANAAPSTPPVPASTPPLPSARRARRQQRYQQVRELHQHGRSQRAIARQLGLDRETVARFVHAGVFPERAARPYPTRVDGFEDYLRQRWQDGCGNAAQLARELAARGFTGSYHAVRRYLARWRRDGRDHPANHARDVTPDPHTPSARRVAAWLLKADADLMPEELTFVNTLLGRNPDLTQAGLLAQEFSQLIRQRRPDELDDWLARVMVSPVPDELRTFAKGLRADHAAVKAALSLDWSQGQVEGQVNRVKLIKRQMYGRAKFDLLRQRVLYRG